MLVYHGSNSNFRALRISKSLVKHNSTMLNEGLGIYFTTDKEIARSYGRYIYTLSINDTCFKDFRKKQECIKYVNSLIKYVYSNIKIDIRSYIDAANLANYLYFGGISIYQMGEEAILCLDSNEHWHRLGVTKINKVYALIRRFDRNVPAAYMFNYNIKNIGVIKRLGDDIVKIVGKELSY